MSAVLSVCLLAMSFAVVPAGRAGVSLPVWSVGDYWAYSTFGLIIIPDGTILNYSVAGHDTVTWQGVAYPTYHVTILPSSLQNATLSGVSMKRLEGDAWYSETDLSLVRMTRREWTYGGGCPTCWANTSETWTAGPPLAPRFPLTVGVGWIANSTVNIQTVSIDNGVLVAETNQTGGGSFSVAPNVSIDVPAGNFTATPMTENLTKNGQWTFIGANPLFPLTFAEETVAYYSPVVGNAVCVVDIGWGHGCSGVGASDGFELVSYGHAPPAGLAQLFGLNYVDWAIIALATVAACAVVIVLARRRPPRIDQEPAEPSSQAGVHGESPAGPKR